jgi:CDI immunity protein
MSDYVWRRSAGIYFNDRLMCIQTYSGYRIQLVDHEAKSFLLPPYAADESLGESLAESLRQSRSLTVEEVAQRRGRSKEQYEAWVASLMGQYGYKSRQALFRKMKHCSVEITGENIRLMPMRRDRGEAWEGLNGSETVFVPVLSSPAEIGAALRLALSRCA